MIPQSYGERGFTFSEVRKPVADAGYGRAREDRPFVQGDGGRIIHRKTGQVLKRAGRAWVGVKVK